MVRIGQWEATRGGAVRIGHLAGGDTKDKRGKGYTTVSKAWKRAKYGNAHLLCHIIGGGVCPAYRAKAGAAVPDDLRPEAGQQVLNGVRQTLHGPSDQISFGQRRTSLPTAPKSTPAAGCNTTVPSNDKTPTHQGGSVGVEVRVEGLTKSFGRQSVWSDVSLTLPAGEISVLLGPSGTGKSVFLKCLVGLLEPDRGSVWIGERDLPRLRERDLYEVRKLFGVLFQDGALFGSMDIFDNVAFPLREHTRWPEAEIRDIVTEKLEMVGLLGSERKLPGEVSGGMRKRAGLARALVLDPQIVLFDEPDSGLDPVRTAYLNQLIIDLNQRTEATFLIVTHDINTARSVPDNIGLIYHGHLAMFGPTRWALRNWRTTGSVLDSNISRGPIGMTEEKDADELAAELGLELPSLPPIPRQLQPSNGLRRRAEREPGRWCLEHNVLPPVGSFR
jgi:phospholipid/cholesterol/gamma-HCH transport system ATP-binding protein